MRPFFTFVWDHTLQVKLFKRYNYDNMRRDFDLARTILLAIEANEDATGHGWITLGKINGYSQEQVSYHVRLLNQAGLIEAINLSDNLGFRWEPIGLTWQGHEFLDSARDETLWKEAKRQLKNMGSISLQVLLQILLKLAESQVPS